MYLLLLDCCIFVVVLYCKIISIYLKNFKKNFSLPTNALAAIRRTRDMTHSRSRLTLHRYGDGLAVLGRDGGRSHGYQGLSGRDGGHDAGLLLRLGDANGGSWGGSRGAASGGEGRLGHFRWVDKEAAPRHSSWWRAVAVQQAGGGGGHTWTDDRRKIFEFFVSLYIDGP